MKELIYNQNQIPREKWRYGLRSSAKVGCGWIATCNALILMGQDVDVDKLIRSYERQLPLVNGNVGTLFCGPALMLRKMGYSVHLSSIPSHYDDLARGSDAAIIFYYWHRGLKIGSHFAALHHTEQGFVGYNTFQNSTGPDAYGPSLEAFLKKQNYHATCLITVNKKSR